MLTALASTFEQPVGLNMLFAIISIMDHFLNTNIIYLYLYQKLACTHHLLLKMITVWFVPNLNANEPKIICHLVMLSFQCVNSQYCCADNVLPLTWHGRRPSIDLARHQIGKLSIKHHYYFMSCHESKSRQQQSAPRSVTVNNICCDGKLVKSNPNITKERHLNAEKK